MNSKYFYIINRFVEYSPGELNSPYMLPILLNVTFCVSL